MITPKRTFSCRVTNEIRKKNVMLIALSIDFFFSLSRYIGRMHACKYPLIGSIHRFQIENLFINIF
jgi:hypothetical protein